MNIESIVLPATNDFASLYIAQKDPVKGFFHYDITENNVFQNRLEDLMERKFDRDRLVEVIENYMEPFPSSEQTKISLQKLRDQNSTVVIGGQQAGLLTGPLYTIHKVISIIKLAEQQEANLGVPVVPVFWIAGEDHDFLEINHVYVESGKIIEKISYPEKTNLKQMASDTYFDKETMKQWVDTIFMHLGERPNTNHILQSLHIAISKSETITQFFSYLIMALFKDYGLLIIDSADPNLRNMEKAFFAKLIDQAPTITDAVLKQQNLIKKHGFTNLIEIEGSTANLFYYHYKERILLDYSPEENTFGSKRNHIEFHKEELLQLLDQEPEKFSNNVVTRPLVQEWLFPTLAFIAGPGEIAYWGELKQAFETIQIKMPPLIPRINITFLESAIARDVKDLNLDLTEVLRDGIDESKTEYLNSLKDEELEKLLDDIAISLDQQYETIFQRIENTSRGLLPFAQKNLSFHKRQIELLKNKANWVIEEKYNNELEKYNRIERHLRPNGSPQERIWNIYYYLNDYGESFIKNLMELTYEFDGKHKVIKI